MGSEEEQGRRGGFLVRIGGPVLTRLRARLGLEELKSRTRRLQERVDGQRDELDALRRQLTLAQAHVQDQAALARRLTALEEHVETLVADRGAGGEPAKPLPGAPS